jgi:putative endonuclease
MSYFLYVLQCFDKSLYTGITTDVKRRFEEHKAGKGGHYTRAHRVVKIIYTEKYKNRSEASKRESEIKSWTKKKKLEFIKNNV